MFVCCVYTTTHYLWFDIVSRHFLNVERYVNNMSSLFVWTAIAKVVSAKMMNEFENKDNNLNFRERPIQKNQNLEVV